MIQTSKIPEMIDPQSMYSTNGQEAWRVLGIMQSSRSRPSSCEACVRPSACSAARASAWAIRITTRRNASRGFCPTPDSRSFRRRPGADGGCESRCERGPVAGHRPQHSSPQRTGGQRLPGHRINFRYFFARKMMFVALRVRVRRASRRIRDDRRADRVPDAGADRKESQNSRSSSSAPSFWKGLIDWMKDKLVGEGMISAGDLDLMRSSSSPRRLSGDLRLLREPGLPGVARRARQDAEPLNPR